MTGPGARAKEAPEWMGKAPECEHGTRVYVSQLGQYGLWHAWGCPTKECAGTKDSDNPGLIFVKEPKEEGK